MFCIQALNPTTPDLALSISIYHSIVSFAQILNLLCNGLSLQAHRDLSQVAQELRKVQLKVKDLVNPTLIIKKPVAKGPDTATQATLELCN